MVVVLIIRERLTKGSPWPGSIITILLIAKRKVIIGGSLSSPFVAQLPFRWSISSCMALVFSSWERWLPPRAPASMGGMYTNFPIPPSLKINKMILTLGPHIFFKIQTWTYHGWTLISLQHQRFPQTAPIVRMQFSSQAQRLYELRPKEPNTMNL